MRISLWMGLLTTAILVSCSRSDNTGGIARVEKYELTSKDKTGVLAAIKGYEGTNRFEILSCDDWGETAGVTEYRVIVDDSAAPDEPRSYWLVPETGGWRVVSRQL